jgi:hypothetical protein
MISTKLKNLLSGALLTLGCASTTVDPTGGETHFLTCDTDRDCDVLSPSYRCEQGTCRNPEEPGSSSQALVVGDSFFASEHRLTPALEAKAPQRYRDQSSLFDNTLALFGRGIAAQYAAGKAAGSVRLVVMAGGGADALLGSCDADVDACPALRGAASAASDLLTQMANDHVERVVYVYYPDPTDAALRTKIDTLRPMLRHVCEGASIPCRWVDLRSIFDGKSTDYLASDGMNPSAAGAEASATAIWQAIVQ